MEASSVGKGGFSGGRSGPDTLAVMLVGGLGLLAMVGACLAWSPGMDGIRVAIRATARTSLVFFLMAFGASALFTLAPGMASRWMLMHRRQWGWLTVLSHTLHLLCVIAYWRADPATFEANLSMGTLVGGGFAYLVLWAMGATSFDRTAAWLGRKAWSRLHTWGGHYIWLIFFMGNAQRVPQQPEYLIPAVPLAAVMVLRLWAARRRRLRPGRASAAPA